MKTKFRFSGCWQVFDENGHYVGEINKVHNGWKPSFGYFRNSVFDTLKDARKAI